ncbi:hypothetical protein SARC_02609 [Sphaeroforma arctica JP610]|uniref:Tetratricopeptide repeat protein n=1 Tax=Sphaeroforma arctica JP610 TaxID=667725 RepID=A0A0L0G862_9EUKA|nr:hypothetical protein SARC_02609 [Sphaeroforma arctica JP610]KNC85190.1 hypothetical protein SARC_02609 [Sphaeroforma arctica JP610]|eukprot:XP_014159092.1 hypothetical protein SARC_02609 [Sphaeroforma arctica JP610]
MRIDWIYNAFLGLTSWLGEQVPLSSGREPQPLVPLALGNYTMPITHNGGKGLQKMFDSGMMHEFGFNQREAAEAFRNAIKADPTHCAMCYFGLAYSHGAYLNKPHMSDDDIDIASDSIGKAMRIITANPEDFTELEYGLIGAMNVRFQLPRLRINQTATFVAYAEALEALAAKVGDNGSGGWDVLALLAESYMTLESTHYYTVETMDDTNVTARLFNPYSRKANTILVGMLGPGADQSRTHYTLHPLALHLYLHLTEPGVPGHGGPGAGLGEHAADVLSSLNLTGSGHLEHMPGHLYLRTGRYADAVSANIKANEADQLYMDRGMSAYFPCHNIYLGVYSANMAGMRSDALHGAGLMRSIYAKDPNRKDYPNTQEGWNAALTTYVRFGDWQLVLDDKMSVPDMEPPPLFAHAVRYYSRGLAHLHVIVAGDVDEGLTLAEHELAKLQRVRLDIGDSRLAPLVKVAEQVLEAAILLKIHATMQSPDSGPITYSSGLGRMMADNANGVTENTQTRATRLLKKASDAQNSWYYIEPPEWHMPVLQCYGKALLDAGLYEDAVEVYNHDLRVYPNNGYSLTGLLQASQGLGADVSDIRARLAHSWKDADVPLPMSSCSILEFY